MPHLPLIKSILYNKTRNYFAAYSVLYETMNVHCRYLLFNWTQCSRSSSCCCCCCWSSSFSEYSHINSGVSMKCCALPNFNRTNFLDSHFVVHNSVSLRVPTTSLLQIVNQLQIEFVKFQHTNVMHF